jgi:hypothetical protein
VRGEVVDGNEILVLYGGDAGGHCGDLSHIFRIGGGCSI